jgi:hypothetical protein
MSQATSFDSQLPKGDAKNEAAQTRARVRPVALPVEHGGWGLTLEPIALGLLVAPSPAGFFLALATLSAFLARHPLKIIAGDRWRRGRRFPRTALAERFALLYSLVAATSLVAAIACAPNHNFLWVLVAVSPLAAVQLAHDAAGRSRALLPELAGSVAMASAASAITLAGGWALLPSLALWALLATRLVPSILYVRVRLYRIRGGTASPLPTLVAHLLGLAVVMLLVCLKLLPVLALLPPIILLLRAALGCSAQHSMVTVKQVGVREVVFGATTVIAVAAGYWLGW